MKPILIDFPDRIETERLYLRPCLPGDGRAVHESIQSSREQLKKWLPFAVNPQTEDETEEEVRRSYARFILREDIRLHIYRREDDRFIGSTGLHRINWEAGRLEIGYWCDSRHAKNGYMTEAASALVAFAFDHLQANRIEICCDSLNIDSRKIPERLGFTLEAILEKDELSTDGKQLRDTCIYAKLRK
ncbi:GNAT family N-acetyltransferase [Bacillus sp. V3-13]|uniref:GNAT family N-acetyltransferase n=1 Tax=Bacillus sp. V3-13 TaxID=2053728 RepID=UPI000C75C820|nr:GNAT family N-acetyltransferase [Bacillus sp. V3-13]PLR76385.1 GNAT family N-acetyltransferase [Bacillus sp. V3-13]